VELVAGGPAERAGLRPEDLVVAVAGQPVERMADLQRLMTHDLIGTDVDVLVVREGRELSLRLRPEELEV
jgi:serine protease Do